ncbi:putative bifunctional diguanylate cyclase/phosphodiesterase [Glaciecola siphonariae]|uniref:Bifunctional diguanylate cyclase/phosphodiesterase n=1 Tax=Glaciecola siphonariae TaxID=521012 RepID=A0ABV9LVY9_9ALTE
MHLSLIQALGIVDCVILKRSHLNVFRIEQNNASWFKNIFGVKDDKVFFVLEDQSFFLSDFFQDAQDFWNMHGIGQLESGVWTESFQDKEFYLEAIAASTEDAQYLVIKNIQREFQQQRQTIQLAREMLISNDEIIERHDYLNERLRSILLNNMKDNNSLPLYNAIQMADVGVIIIDQNQVAIETNPAACKIFELNEETHKDQVFETLFELLSRQYPEKTSLHNIHQSFTGELYWHQPPKHQKWLKIDIQEVLDDKGNPVNWIITISDITRVKYLTQTNEDLLLRDSLTGLPNRQHFMQVLGSKIQQAERFSSLSIDIINFKRVNESFGYIRGDEVLKRLSEILQSALAPQDFITRVGADEFMILLGHSDAEQTHPESFFVEKSRDLAQRLIDIVSITPLFTDDNFRCDLGINVGIAQYPKDANNTEELLTATELALNEAKRKHGNAIQIYSKALKEVSQRRVALEASLRKAARDGDFELFLQPVFDMTSDQIIKAEALIRWKLDGEFISPEEFIPIAEDNGLINTIGRWVIDRACEMIASLKATGISIPVSVNFSPKQIHDINLVEHILAAITRNHVDTNTLELEITEGVFIHNYDKVKSFLTSIKAANVNVSIDDFGTGYSSLAYLKHLPIDTLKIDRSFISDVDVDEDDQAIVGAVIAMAEKLKLDVIAEGVETHSQKTYLVNNKCAKAQGFICSKALPLNDFISLYRA